MGFRFGLIAFLLLSSARAFAQNGCSNPPAGYYQSGLNCMPNAPSSDFDPTLGNYPTCGAGRIALSGDGSYSATSFSASGTPAWNGTAYSYTNGTDTENYSYTYSSFPNPPVYGFPPTWRCYCMSAPSTATFPGIVGPTPSPIPAVLPNGSPRQYPVTYDVVNSQTQTGSVFYGPVAISNDNLSDGRLYARMTGGSAACGCPNFNESVQPNGPADGSNYVGTNCEPMVNLIVNPVSSTPVRVLTSYSPPALSSSIILSSASEVNAQGGGYVTTIYLPNSGSDQVGLTPYARKIWTCADPYFIDSSASPAVCTFNPAAHACNAGGGSFSASSLSVNIEASPVSDSISPITNHATQFNNTVNPKLACCLNAFHSDGSDTYEKFDCVDNSQTTYTSFDQLWAGSDNDIDATAGGQLNAIILTDGSSSGTNNTTPRIISGFYGLDGHHCDQFSEFAYPSGGSITHYRVDPTQITGQQTRVGGSGFVATGVSDPVPTAAAYATLNASVTGTWGKTIPKTQQDFLTCPILVRAAIIASCPEPTMAPSALTAISLASIQAPGTYMRCPVAAGIQVHVRIEQVFEITGTAPAPVVDTMIQLNETTSLDVSKIILSKTGNQCPPGTTKRGDVCSY